MTNAPGRTTKKAKRGATGTNALGKAIEKIQRKTAYEVAIAKIFCAKYRHGDTEVRFSKSDIDGLADDPEVLQANGGKPLSNPPALIYEFRSRRELPSEINDLAPPANGTSWTIELDGKSKYVFRQSQGVFIEPRTDMKAIEIPEATPEIVAMYALDDEQALLAKIRYNRLVDIFLGIAAYSLQNHLRTSATMRVHEGKKFRSQIEIDELYVGIDRDGTHYAIPIQAKGGKDKLSKAQSKQDIAWCKEKLPDAMCRAISAQFVHDEIVLFLLAEDGNSVKVQQEQRYKLVPAKRRPTGKRAGGALD